MKKILTAGQMGAVDRATIEMGIPGLILMESAAARVVEFLAERFAPLASSAFSSSAAKATTAATAWPSPASFMSASSPSPARSADFRSERIDRRCRR